MATKKKLQKDLSPDHRQLIDALKVKLDCRTDKALAEFLDVAPSSITRWRASGLPKAIKSLILLHLNREDQITVRFIERLKRHLSCYSDAELAAILGLKESQIVGLRYKELPQYMVKILDHVLPPLEEEEEVNYEERFNNKPCIYFVQSLDTGRVKIGFTHHLKKRMAKMQTDSSEILKVLFAFSPLHSEEKALHTIFAETNFHGEWFELSSELLEFIEEQKYEEKLFN